MADFVAGREADARVAAELMGWTHDDGEAAFHYWHDPTGVVAPLPRYSTDVEGAWQVFREAVLQFGYAEVHADMEDDGPDSVGVSVGFEAGATWVALGPFPEAICRAALAALDGVRRLRQESSP